MLLPGITSLYYARSRLGPFIRHSFSNGYWVSYPLAFGDFPASWRHYVPLIFVFGLTIPSLVGLYWPPAMWLSGCAAAAYVVAAIIAGIHGAHRTARPGLALLLPPVFLLLHLTYGLGTIVGLVRAGWHRLFGSRG